MTTELRSRIVADMRSAGLAASTQTVYLYGVRGLAAYYRRSPDLLSEDEVRSYLLHVRDERGVAQGTYKPCHGGIRFLSVRTLEREWPLFSKKVRAPKRLRLPDVLSDAEARALLSHDCIAGL
jgi:hypothetical protein